MKLEGKVAIITGAATGIGRATALLFAREGAKLVIADIKDKEAAETVGMIKQAGGDAIFVHTDVTSVADLGMMVKAAVTAFGRLDILFSNAGVPGPGVIENTSEEAFDRAIAVNLKAGFFGAKLAVPEMRKSGGGCILFTSSGLGLATAPHAPTYSVTKAALISLARNLAVYLGKDNIRVNAICPGPVDTTPLYREMSALRPDAQEKVRPTIAQRPIARFGTVDDMAEAALFLVSPEAAFITGVALPVDGGGAAR